MKENAEQCPLHSGIEANIELIKKTLDEIKDDIRDIKKTMPSKEMVSLQDKRISTLSGRMWGALITACFALAGWLFQLALALSKR